MLGANIGEPSPRVSEYSGFTRVRTCLDALIYICALFGLGILIFDPAYSSLSANISIFQTGSLVCRVIFIINLFTGLYADFGLGNTLKHHWPDILILPPIIIGSDKLVHPAQLILLRQILLWLQRTVRPRSMTGLSEAISERPARLIIFSFIGVILLGALLLSLPASVNEHNEPSFLTGLFTATSAVCVTGLIVEDTGSFFNLFGQIIIMILIQIGGLGIVTITAGISVLIGKKMFISQNTVMQNILDQTDRANLKLLLKQIFTWTILFETVGATILCLRFFTITNVSFSRALYLGIFHSISAFCNAGFALFKDSLMSYAFDPVITLTVAFLIVSGGLGFFVWFTLDEHWKKKRKSPGDFHSALVLLTTIMLIAGGTTVIFFLEVNRPSMAHLTFAEKISAAFFQSVTTRTAGFNTVDIASLRLSTLFFMAILMFIGASHGSTGGGIKTTTLATMIFAIWSFMRGSTNVIVMRRTIPRETVLKSFVIAALSFGFVSFFTFFLLMTEKTSLLQTIFEVVSAFGTVGLSMGITPSLSSAGRILIMILMFAGRVGTLTIALSLHSRPANERVEYPDARVLVG